MNTLLSLGRLLPCLARRVVKEGGSTIWDKMIADRHKIFGNYGITVTDLTVLGIDYGLPLPTSGSCW